MEVYNQSQPQNQIAVPMSPLPPTNISGSCVPPHFLNHDDQELESAARAVREHITAINRGETSWLRLRSSPAIYERLIELFCDDLAFNELRHDYFLADQEFTMGGETRTHAVFCLSIATDITCQLRALSNDEDPSVKKFAPDIANCGSARIQLSLRGTSPEHCPDVSITHRLAKYPGAVIEVAHSQQGGDLVRLAQEYILGSKGNIRCVLGLKLQYPAGNKATVSVWERRLTTLDNGKVRLGVEQTITNQIFRTENGLPDIDSPGINIPLAHLAPTPEIAKQIQDAPENLSKIQITARVLCGYLKKAEELHATAANGGLTDPFDDELEIDDLEVPPVEKVSRERERRLRKDEEKVPLRYEKEDPGYIG